MESFIHLDVTVPPDGRAVTAVQTAAGDKGMISGVVIDEAGAAVENAAIQLFSAGEKPAEGLLSACFTDEEGCFLFGPVQPGGRYRLRVFVGKEARRGAEGLSPVSTPASSVAEPDSPAAYQAFRDMYR